MPKFIDLTQSTDAWRDWRKTVITATDASTLLGNNKYCTPFVGWQRKVGEIPEQEVTPAMLRGQREEPKARAMFIEKYGINMTPRCVESEEYYFLGASLDGISDCGRFLLEIKSQAPVSTIPQMHLDQMQHQLICSKAEMCYYVTIWDDIIYTETVYPDEEWQRNYVPQAYEYFRKILNKEPPELIDRDYKNMESHSAWRSYANEYIKLNEQIKHLESIKDSYKTELIALCGDQNCSGSGIKIAKRKVKGRVDYDTLLTELQVEEDKLNKYRKPDSSTWAITVDKK